MRQLTVSFLVLFVSVQGISHASDSGTPENMGLIPAGEFTMGSDDGGSDEKPVGRVYLDAFHIDKYEVTNEQFCKFLNGKGNQTEGEAKWLDIDSEDCLIEKARSKYRPKSGRGNHPVVEVTWHGAKAYAKWAGKRLPTEAEWEKAARGGVEGKKYPWGNTISHDNANYSGAGGKDTWDRTSPAGSFAPNGYGLCDMAGNVWEYCSDWYGESYYKDGPERNPKGPMSGSYRVIRGGSWVSFATRLRCAGRYGSNPDLSWRNVGFRCARTP